MELERSDAWVLESVLLAGGLLRRGRLRSIIAAGDACSHAIFEYEELDRGLARLIAAGLVERRSDRFVETRMATAIWKRTVPRRMGIIEALPRLEEALRTIRIEGEVAEEPVISKVDFESAVRAYVS
jgi:hypothetical protein